MRTPDDYLALVTSEHRGQPLFGALLKALAAGYSDAQAVSAALAAGYDLDLAAGAQLDAVGEWIGLGRRLTVPLSDVFFSWDSTAALGWDSGSWKDPLDPGTTLVSLPDDAYRNLLRAKIAANNWDGTMSGAVAIWNQAFGGTQTIILQDNQDMSMVVGFVGPPLSALQQALLTGGYLPLKPEGVRIAFYAVPVNTGPLFAWDADTANLSGWETGSWAKQL